MQLEAVTTSAPAMPESRGPSTESKACLPLQSMGEHMHGASASPWDKRECKAGRQMCTHCVKSDVAVQFRLARSQPAAVLRPGFDSVHLFQFQVAGLQIKQGKLTAEDSFPVGSQEVQTGAGAAQGVQMWVPLTPPAQVLK